MAVTTLSYRTDADVVKTEGPNRISRDEVVFASGEGAFVLGEVVGQLTAAPYKFAKFDTAASDGSQTAAAVLLQAVDATSADVRAVVLARHAEVVSQALVWPVGISAANKRAAILALQAKGVVARQGV